MVYRLPNWFVYEAGDSVTVLKNGETGLVLATEELEVKRKHQIVKVKTRYGVDTYNAKDLDLRKRLRTISIN
jgi:hypothetical protein